MKWMRTTLLLAMNPWRAEELLMLRKRWQKFRSFPCLSHLETVQRFLKVYRDFSSVELLWASGALITFQG